MHIGSVVGRYVVVERLGAGGMGVVYAAFDPDLDRKIALKLLHAQAGGADRGRREERLVREAKAIAKLSHPNIVAIYDVGVHDEQLFLAMEHLSGGTLRRWLAAGRRTWREVLKVFLDAGRGLAAAHAEKLIHRDFKPENVLLDKNAVAKVADFGLVRLSEALKSPAHAVLDGSDASDPVGSLADLQDADPLTRTGALVGTPAYMAPEQFQAHPLDERTDQFAFCVALYKTLYNEHPFANESIAELAAAVTSGQMRPVPPASPVPGWLRKALLRGLAVDPRQRYRSMSDLLETLSRDPIARRRRFLGVLAVVSVAATTVLVVQRRAEHRRLEFEGRIAVRLREGEQAWREAQSTATKLGDLRRHAFSLFDTRERERGERVWTDTRVAAEALDASLDRAERAWQAALEMDPTRADTRQRLAELLFERASQAEREHRDDDVARYVAALDAVDTSGSQRKRWRQPGSVSIETDPPAASVAIERFETGAGSLITAVPLAPPMISPVTRWSLLPGSYRLRIELPGRAETLYPFIVKRGESSFLRIHLAPAGDVPPDFRYIAAGRFLYGDHDEDWRLSFLNAAPIHERELPAYLIKAHETTFGEWIEFLSALSAAERAARLPTSSGVHGAVALSQSRSGEWTLSLDISRHPVRASSGGPLVYAGRPAPSAAQDWMKMPVVGVSVRDMKAYLGWLASSGKVPGARLCSDAEWERGARGADGREYPGSALRLAATDANVDVTYGRVPGAYGPDEVGRYPRSRSPFGLDDMAGNVWEVVENEDSPNSFVIRGGCYYEAFKSAQSNNREFVEIETRSHLVGLRVCADLPQRTERSH